MWNPFRSKPEPPKPVAYDAIPTGTSRVRPDKRAVLLARIAVALIKLARRTDEPALRKAAELRRSLRALELETEAAALRAGDIVVEPGTGSLNARGE